MTSRLLIIEIIWMNQTLDRRFPRHLCSARNEKSGNALVYVSTFAGNRSRLVTQEEAQILTSATAKHVADYNTVTRRSF
jgi:hypothetical protein